VLSKSVAGINLVKFLHHAVSGDLGYDRSTGNGETQSVASGYSSLRDGALRQGYSINKEEVGLFGQFFHRLHHGQSGCLQDIDGVDDTRGNDANAHGHGLSANQVKKRFTFSGVNSLLSRTISNQGRLAGGAR
jgi:hypothetical protein